MSVCMGAFRGFPVQTPNDKGLTMNKNTPKIIGKPPKSQPLFHEIVFWLLPCLFVCMHKENMLDCSVAEFILVSPVAIVMLALCRKEDVYVQPDLEFWT